LTRRTAARGGNGYRSMKFWNPCRRRKMLRAGGSPRSFAAHIRLPFRILLAACDDGRHPETGLPRPWTTSPSADIRMNVV
jgi:hypothetical protein